MVLRAWNFQTLFFLQITKFQLISLLHSGRKSPKKSHFKPNVTSKKSETRFAHFIKGDFFDYFEIM